MGGPSIKPAGRDAAAPPAGATRAEDGGRLSAARFVSLTTYRLSGAAVATPVWVAGDGPRLLVWTGKNTGKAKRLRRGGRVSVAVCNGRGQVRGEAVSGTARLLPDDELARVERLFAAKYRIGFPVLRAFERVRRLVMRRPQSSGQVGIEIALE